MSQTPIPSEVDARKTASEFNNRNGHDPASARRLAVSVLEDNNQHALAGIIHSLDYPAGSRDEMSAVFQKMETGCGNFCQALAIAWYKADSDNRRRIEMAFQETIRRHLSVIQADKQKETSTPETNP